MGHTSLEVVCKCCLMHSLYSYLPSNPRNCLLIGVCVNWHVSQVHALHFLVTRTNSGPDSTGVGLFKLWLFTERTNLGNGKNNGPEDHRSLIAHRCMTWILCLEPFTPGVNHEKWPVHTSHFRLKSSPWLHLFKCGLLWSPSRCALTTPFLC